jgi:hypothetical protein
MRLGIILSLVCVSALLLPLKLAEKVESQDNGPPGKPKWSLNNIKRKGEDIKLEVLPSN